MQKKSFTNTGVQIAAFQIFTSTKMLQKIITLLTSFVTVFIRLTAACFYKLLTAETHLACAVLSSVNSIFQFITPQLLNNNRNNNFTFTYSHLIVSIVSLISIFTSVTFTGCSHTAVNRGHIISLEYNRPPWIGCPPDTGCDSERTCKLGHNKSSCNCNNENSQSPTTNGKKFRRYCGLKPDCTANNPCCEIPGCGMWIDPTNPNSFAPNSFAPNSRFPRACGLTPFCSPMKPCGMTPNCGRPIANPYLANQPAIMQPYGFNNNLINGLTLPSLSFPSLPLTIPSAAPISPTPIPTSPTPISTTQSNPIPNNNNNNNNVAPPKPVPTKPTTVAGPNGILVSMGIVPGVSAIHGGGYVAANGVVTPAGQMTPNGVQLPNGTINSQIVIKTCGSHPGCSPNHPCGMTQGCGTAVPVGLVLNNAAPLAAELIARNNGFNGNNGFNRNNGGVFPAANNNYGNYAGYNGYGNVTQVNGIAPQNLRNGINYSYQQNNYPNNYRTNYVTNPNYINAANNPEFVNDNGSLRNPPPLQPELYDNDQSDTDNIDDENNNSINETAVTKQDKKSMMPLPRFHSVPTEPAFNRRKGISVQKTNTNENENNNVSQNTNRYKNNNSNTPDDAEIEHAYLEGMVAALDEVEAEIDAQTTEIKNAKMKRLAIEKAEKLQAKIDAKTEQEAEIAEFETNRQKQLNELAIQAEQIKFEQQKHAKILEKRQKEIEEESRNLIIEKNQLKQKQLAAIKSQNNNQQQTISNNSNIQPVNYKTSTKNNENVFASAVNFIKGNKKNQTADNSNIDRKKQNQKQNQNNNKNIVAQNNTNSQQKSNNNSQYSQNTTQPEGTISRLLSPITNLIGTNKVKPKQLPQPNQKVKTKITNDEEFAAQELPSRPATYPSKQRHNITNIQYSD
ncbi:MAG: hypothetical protein LBE18_02860 [Planctomycetaceae bacterium]|jgi:hypothetical protein|nr:hypothetical protein [Planctomycetaceae bacterium]